MPSVCRVLGPTLTSWRVLHLDEIVIPRIDYSPLARHDQAALGTSPPWWKAAAKTSSGFNRVLSGCEIVTAFLLKELFLDQLLTLTSLIVGAWCDQSLLRSTFIFVNGLMELCDGGRKPSFANFELEIAMST